MKAPRRPKNLNQIMGFGKYSSILVSDVYSGSLEIPLRLWRNYLEIIFRTELTPGNFSCNNISELQEVLYQEKVKSIDSNILKHLLISRLDYLLHEEGKIALNSQNWNMRYVSDNYEYEKIEFNKNNYAPNFDFSNFYRDYFSNLIVPMTNQDWQFVQVEFVKNYIIFSNNNGGFHKNPAIDCQSLAEGIVDGYWQNGPWGERWDPPFSKGEPTIINLKTATPPAYDSGPECVLAYGNPSYIDWMLRKTEFFITSKSLEYLESLDVQTPPSIKLTKVADDVIAWAITNNSYKYEFSEEAKTMNQIKYSRYTELFEEYINPSESSYERYTQQDAIDDAFGGQEDAYWNID